MAINKKLLHFATKTNFSTQLANSNIDSRSIVFIKDTGEIWTHDKLYSCASWGTNQTNYVPLTIGGVSYNLSKDGHTHSYLPLSGGQLTGQLSLLQGAGGGIIFPNDSFGGGGDSASIKLLNPAGGESTEMTFTMANDADDIINFNVPSIDGVKINRYTVWNAGNFTNLTQLTTRNFSDLQNKPTTLGGYEITDAVTLNTTQTIAGTKYFTSTLKAYANSNTNALVKLLSITDGYNELGSISSYNTGSWNQDMIFSVSDGTAPGNIVEKLRIKGSGGLTTSYSITASSFVKSGSSDSYVLLGGGGHAAISGLSVGGATNSEYVSNDWVYMRFHWNGQGGQPTWLWGGNDPSNMYVYNPSNFSVNYATSAGNSDTLDGYHASSFIKTNGTINNNIDNDYGEGFVTFDPVPTGTPPISSPNIRTINIGNNFARRTQLAFNYESDNAYFRRNHDGVWNTWREFIHSGNIGSQSVSYATSAGNADTVDSQHFVYSNSSNSPTYLWGSDSNGTSFLASRANISVNYANSSGNSDSVDGLHSSNIVSGGSNKKSISLTGGNANTSDSTNASGFYYGSNTTGMPSTDWWNWITCAGDAWTGTDGYGYQLGMSFWSDDFRVRRLTSGTWQNWQTVLHTGNYTNWAVSLGTAQAITAAHNFTSHSLTMSPHYYHGSYDGQNHYIHMYPNGGIGTNYSNTHMRFWNGSGSFIEMVMQGNGYWTWNGNTVWHSGNLTGTQTGHTHNYAALSNLIVAGNEHNWVHNGYSGDMWINYQDRINRDSTALIGTYHFGNGRSGYANLTANLFSGNGSSLTSLNASNISSGTIGNARLPQRLMNYTYQYNIDPNNFKENGFSYTSGPANLPPNVSDANILGVFHTSGGWGHQLAFKFAGGGTTGSGYDGKDVYSRTFNLGTGVWTGWYAFLSTGNYRNILDPVYRPMGGGWSGNGVPGTREFGWVTNDGSGEVAFKSYNNTMNMIIDGNIYVTDNSYQVIHAGNIASQSVNYATSSGNASNSYYQVSTGIYNDWVASFQNTPAHATSFREMSAGGPSGTWWFMQNFRHSNGGSYWGRQIAWGWEDNAHEMYSRNITANSFSGWVRFLNSNNYNSFSPTLTGGNASGTWGINVTGAANRLYQGGTTSGSAMVFNWNGQGGQPTWLWGGTDGTNMYVYNPSNFNVNYATSSGNSDTVDNQHFSYTNTSDSPTWLWASNSSGTNFLANRANISVNYANYSTKLQVIDNRGTDVLPNSYSDYRVTPFFNELTGVGTWASGITVAGWTAGYSRWQILGYSSTGANDNLYFRSQTNGGTNTWNTLRTILHSGNYTAYSPSLTGSGASGTWGINISGNAGSATKLSTNRTNWSNAGVIDNVVGQLVWKNYGNGHTIFDASNGSTPNGNACDRENSSVEWTSSYPTLMGYNGSQTYGVRVDSSRMADKLRTARSIWGQSFDGTGNVSGTFTSGIISIGDSNEIWSTGAPLYINHSTRGGQNVYMCTGNGNVGIGTNATAYKLDVAGTLRATGAVTLSSTLNVAGATYAPSLSALTIGVLNSDPTTGRGLSLYGGPDGDSPTYGIMFAGTSTFGTHGSVTGDWATYFTMDNTPARGWIFQRGSTNVASISAGGNAKFDGTLNVVGATTLSSTLGVSSTVTAPTFTVSANNLITTNGGYLGLRSSSNEITVGGSTSMYVNYRAALGDTPTSWMWLAGSSSSWANFYIGSLNTYGPISSSSTITTASYVTSAQGYYKSGSSNDYVLLGGSGHKSISDFRLKSEKVLKMVFRGFFRWSGTNLYPAETDVVYSDFCTSYVIKRVSAGRYNITFTGLKTTSNIAQDTTLQIFGAGRNINSDGTPCHVSILNVSSNYFDIITADDASPNDTSTFTLYINQML